MHTDFAGADINCSNLNQLISDADNLFRQLDHLDTETIKQLENQNTAEIDNYLMNRQTLINQLQLFDISLNKQISILNQNNSSILDLNILNSIKHLNIKVENYLTSLGLIKVLIKKNEDDYKISLKNLRLESHAINKMKNMSSGDSNYKIDG